MNYEKWAEGIKKFALALEDVANDLGVTMDDIKKWEKKGKVPKEAVDYLKFQEE